MRKKQGQIILLAGSLFVLFNIVFWQAVALPFYEEKKQMESKIELLRIDIDKFKNAGTIPPGNDQMEIINADIMIPAEPGVAVIYEYIAQAADETGVILREACFPEQKNREDKSIPYQGDFSLCVTGAYSSLASFIEIIETNPRFLAIKDIKVSRYDGEGSPNKSSSVNADLIKEDGLKTHELAEEYPERTVEDSMAPLYRAELTINYFYLPGPIIEETISGEQPNDKISAVCEPK